MFSCDVFVLWKTTPRQWAFPAYPVTRRHIPEERNLHIDTSQDAKRFIHNL